MAHNDSSFDKLLIIRIIIIDFKKANFFRFFFSKKCHEICTAKTSPNRVNEEDE